MFRRRTPLTKLSQIRSVVWPERGFRRLFAYLFQRVVRLPDASGSVAIGVASGVAASFLPFIGLHFFIASWIQNLIVHFYPFLLFLILLGIFNCFSNVSVQLYQKPYFQI